MSIGAGIVLFVIGAILAFALNVQVDWVNLDSRRVHPDGRRRRHRPHRHRAAGPSPSLGRRHPHSRRPDGQRARDASVRPARPTTPRGSDPHDLDRAGPAQRLLREGCAGLRAFHGGPSRHRRDDVAGREGVARAGRVDDIRRRARRGPRPRTPSARTRTGSPPRLTTNTMLAVDGDAQLVEHAGFIGVREDDRGGEVVQDAAQAVGSDAPQHRDTRQVRG